MIRWLVFAPAALLAFIAPAEERISLTVEEPIAVLPIAAGQFEVLVHSDQDCGSVTVDPYVELLNETGSVVAADDDGWHRQGDCLASRLSGVAGDGFQIRVRGCCGRFYGSVRVEWLSGTPPEMSVSTTLPVASTVPDSILETTTVAPTTSAALTTTVLPSTLPPVVTDPSTTIAVRDSVPVSTLPATTVEPAPTTIEVISWPTTTIPDRTTATAALPDPVADTSVLTSTTESTTTTMLLDPVTTTIAKPAIAEPDLFDGTHDDVIPEGSTISVAQRRTVVAVSAVFFIAVPRPSTSGSTGRRR